MAKRCGPELSNSPAGASQRSGKPRACAAHNDVMLDLPTSNAPPKTPAAIAAPLVPLVKLRVDAVTPKEAGLHRVDERRRIVIERCGGPNRDRSGCCTCSRRPTGGE